MPSTPFAEFVHADKHRLPGESFQSAMARIALALGDGQQHEDRLFKALMDQRILPAGRIQRGAGSGENITLVNCFVSGTFEDTFCDGPASIMARATEAAKVGRAGGGIGYDFSPLRPAGAFVKGIGGISSGPLGFAGIFDSICAATSSAGNRRGAQMLVLRVDHPDILKFISAKSDQSTLANFNISVAVTDEFMRALAAGTDYAIRHNNVVYGRLDAKEVWNLIMRQTWDWAEPGVLFIDRINEMNNLNYCETISATNPCGEQPLPPHGSCVLSSMNLTKYVRFYPRPGISMPRFDFYSFEEDIGTAIRMLDRVVDVSRYPLEEQRHESQMKRRVGLGVAGLANAGEMMGMPYGSEEFMTWAGLVFWTLRNTAYEESINLAARKGPFPLFDKEQYMDSPFIKTLPKYIQEGIRDIGIRNSHLLSFAPTGTIAIGADNISSGIEPVFSHEYTRKVRTPTGFDTYDVKDYAWHFHGIRGRTADQVTPEEHVAVLALAQRSCDSAVSKTCNVGDDVTFEQFKDLYLAGYKAGVKGMTTFRAAGKRFGILKAKPVAEAPAEGAACTIDATTGVRSCAA